MLKAAGVVLLFMTLIHYNVAPTPQKKAQQRGFPVRAHPEPDHGPIVNLFQWSYTDITKECRDYLRRQGVSAVQVGPVTENIEVPGHPWTEKYEPISYILSSRAGGEKEFGEMVWECARNDVKIYVEVVLNHMTKTYPAGTRGYANSEADTANFDYPAVPFTKEDFFNPSCQLTNEKNITEVWQCEVDGRHKLILARHHVRCKAAMFLNYLISLGVAGFSINSAGYMMLSDLVLVYKLLSDLNTDIHFAFNQKPFIYQEVIDRGAVFTNTYVAQSRNYVTDFHYGLILREYFTGKKSAILDPLRTTGPDQKLKDLAHFSSTVDSKNAIVFVDNHLTQRNLVYKDEEYLSLSKNPKEYRLATAFMLVHGYGVPIITSGYTFTDPTQGPPSDGSRLKSVETKFPDACANGWACEHRDRVISHLIRFSFLARYASLDQWWDNGGNQIALGRNDVGLLVINLDNTDINRPFTTSLEMGHYCDVFTGFYTDQGECTGKEIYVYKNHTAWITLKAGDPNGAIFIYSDSKIPKMYRMTYMQNQWKKAS